MPAPDSIEQALKRLMPVGLSETGQQSIDEMLDRLIGEDPVFQEEGRNRKIRTLAFFGGLGIAAAFFLMMAVPTSLNSDRVEISEPVVGEKIVLMGESGRVENMTDEGWVSDPDGSAMEAVRFRVVEQNTLRDEETGIVVQVSEPREELLLFPVTAF
jgi:hypothetical protein